MPEFVSRQEWDTSSDTRRFSRPLQVSRVKGIVLHYPGDGGDTRAGLDAGQVGALLRGYQRHHRTARGWPDIGYCLAADQAGRLYQCAGPKIAAHSATVLYPGANHERVGVLLVIGDNEAPSAALRETVGWVRSALPAGAVPGWPALVSCHDLSGHRLMPGANTRCPGDHVVSLIHRGGFNPGSVSRDDDRDNIATSPGVERIQKMLQVAGFYGGRIDGVRGEITVAAIKAYQAGQVYPDLLADGVWGKVTDAHAVWVAELQAKLNDWSGRYAKNLPRLRVDYDYGDITAKRVGDWQASNHGRAYKGAIDQQAGPLTCKGLGLRAHP